MELEVHKIEVLLIRWCKGHCTDKWFDVGGDLEMMEAKVSPRLRSLNIRLCNIHTCRSSNNPSTYLNRVRLTRLP